jgi:hypothetical protein
VSLGIAFKGAEGIVLAADSRVTLLAGVQLPGLKVPPGTQLVVPATFDNATKLINSESQRYIAAVTFGTGAIGQKEPRTAASFMPEFDAQLAKELAGKDEKDRRLTVEQFAKRVGDFFGDQWKKAAMPPQGMDDMIFFVAGYDDESAPYGRLYEVRVPSKPTPTEFLPGQFGAIWGGQREVTDRLLQGFDPNLPMLLQEYLNTPANDRAKAAEALAVKLREKLTIPIPWQFLPLQDCVDLCICLLRTTITMQKWVVGIRGVGGAIDLATITQSGGFTPVQQKKISGEQL